MIKVHSNVHSHPTCSHSAEKLCFHILEMFNRVPLLHMGAQSWPEALSILEAAGTAQITLTSGRTQGHARMGQDTWGTLEEAGCLSG